MRKDRRTRWPAACVATVVLGLAAASYGGPRVFVPGNLQVLAIGINNYAGTGFASLDGCVPDAKDIAQAFQAHTWGNSLPPRLMLDADASREGFATAFHQVIAVSKPEDRFVFYFSGHAVTLTKSDGEREWYLIPADFFAKKRPGAPDPWRDEAVLEKQAISARLLKSWTSQIQAASQLIIFDSSHADDAVPVFASHIKSQGDASVALSDTHVEIFGPQGEAMEGRDDNGITHGAFTSALLRGLSGAADAYPRDGKISAEELRIFSSGQLMEETGGSELIASANIGGDFVIARGPVEATRKPDDDSRGVQPVSPPAPPERPAETEGKNYALLIATDHYQSLAWKQLSNPVFDATTLEKDLREDYGFDTELVTNPTKQQLYEVLATYHKKSFAPNDQLLIFIAGHGKYDEVSGEGFIVTTDSKADDPESSTYWALSLIRGAVNNIPANHILFLLDSCFSGVFADPLGAAGGRGGDPYTKLPPLELKKRILKHKARLYLTSGGKEYVPDGRPGQHSPFARDLLDTLERAGDRGGFVTFDTLKENLVRVTPEPHAGEFGSSETGANFIFIATK